MEIYVTENSQWVWVRITPLQMLDHLKTSLSPLIPESDLMQPHGFKYHLCADNSKYTFHLQQFP